MTVCLSIHLQLSLFIHRAYAEENIKWDLMAAFICYSFTYCFSPTKMI